MAWYIDSARRTAISDLIDVLRAGGWERPRELYYRAENSDDIEVAGCIWNDGLMVALVDGEMRAGRESENAPRLCTQDIDVAVKFLTELRGSEQVNPGRQCGLSSGGGIRTPGPGVNSASLYR
jgi:hypothetical protein